MHTDPPRYIRIYNLIRDNIINLAEVQAFDANGTLITPTGATHSRNYAKPVPRQASNCINAVFTDMCHTCYCGGVPNCPACTTNGGLPDEAAWLEITYPSTAQIAAITVSNRWPEGHQKGTAWTPSDRIVGATIGVFQSVLDRAHDPDEDEVVWKGIFADEQRSYNFNTAYACWEPDYEGSEPCTSTTTTTITATTTTTRTQTGTSTTATTRTRTGTTTTTATTTRTRTTTTTATTSTATTTSKTTTTATLTTTTTTTKNVGCYPHLQFTAAAAVATTPSLWTAANVDLLGWPARLETSMATVLSAPEASAIFPTVTRKRYQGTECAVYGMKDATVDANTLTFQVRWTPKNSNTTLLDMHQQDYVGLPPPFGLHKDGEGSESGTVVFGSDKLVSIPETIGNYTMWLVVEDKAGGATLQRQFGLLGSNSKQVREERDQLVVAQWNFEVTGKLPFEVKDFNRRNDGEYSSDDYTNTKDLSQLDCAVGKTYKIAPIANLSSTSGGNIEYVLRGAPKGFFTDASNGEVLAVPTTPTGAGNNGEAVVAQLFAVDASGEQALVQNISISVRHKDADNDANGPNRKGCVDGEATDNEDLFDGTFTCVCTGFYTGDNCDIAAESKITSGKTAGGLIAFIILMLIAGAGFKYRERKLSMRAHDFKATIADMTAKGEIAQEQLDAATAAAGEGNIDGKARQRRPALAPIPREIKRSHITPLSKIGAGAFGDVFKGVLDESNVGGVPGYTVAIKTCQKSGGAGEEDMLKEATVMAMVPYHENIVPLIGVVTSGLPLYLIVPLCENGSLLSFLKVRATGRRQERLSILDKIRMASEIANGMAHLAGCHFVHRDLAARNVLVSASVACRVADFGLSRAVDGAQYYRCAGNGQFPVRWTSPEAMEEGKFTTYSDVWSYGIILGELFNDGKNPYDGLSNLRVMTMVQGKQHDKCPTTCPDRFWKQILLPCWSFDPKSRPTFTELARLLETSGDLSGGYEATPQLEDVNVDGLEQHMPSRVYSSPSTLQANSVMFIQETNLDDMVASASASASGYARRLPAANRRKPSDFASVNQHEYAKTLSLSQSTDHAFDVAACNSADDADAYATRLPAAVRRRPSKALADAAGKAEEVNQYALTMSSSSASSYFDNDTAPTPVLPAPSSSEFYAYSSGMTTILEPGPRSMYSMNPEPVAAAVELVAAVAEPAPALAPAIALEKRGWFSGSSASKTKKKGVHTKTKTKAKTSKAPKEIRTRGMGSGATLLGTIDSVFEI